MVSFISKFLFTATVTAPTFLSLGLIGVIKDSTNYFQLWDDMLENKIFPTSFEWWGINIRSDLNLFHSLKIVSKC